MVGLRRVSSWLVDELPAGGPSSLGSGTRSPWLKACSDIEDRDTWLSENSMLTEQLCCRVPSESALSVLIGLSPYVEPKYVDLILEHLLNLKQDGTLRLERHYFNYCTDLTMNNVKSSKPFNGPPRKLGSAVNIGLQITLGTSLQCVITFVADQS
jgi:hypothetical protein